MNRKRLFQAGTHLHDQVLTPPYELRLCVDDGLEEPQVLHMLPVALDAVDEVLNHFLVHFIAQHCIVLIWSNVSDQVQYIGVSVDNQSLA